MEIRERGRETREMEMRVREREIRERERERERESPRTAHVLLLLWKQGGMNRIFKMLITIIITMII
jgi:hypothetical protein